MFYYAVQVVTGKEKAFIKNAKIALEKINSNIEVIFLTRRLNIRKEGKNSWVEQPLFSSYVFLKCYSEISDFTVDTITKLPDFYHFLPSNAQLKPMHRHDVELLEHFNSIGQSLGPSIVHFDAEDRIVVHKGPLQGLEGNIIKVDRRKKRAKICIDFNDSPILIDLAFEILDKKSTS